MLSLSYKKEKTRISVIQASPTLPSLRKKQRACSQGSSLPCTSRPGLEVNTVAYKFLPLTDYDSIKTYMNASENMTSTSAIQNMQARKNRDLLMECRDNIGKYKKDMQNLKEDWNNNMNMTIASIELRMKEFCSKLKAQCSYADREHAMVHKEGDFLSRAMKNLADEAGRAEKQTGNLEVFSGVSARIFTTAIDEEEPSESKLKES